MLICVDVKASAFENWVCGDCLTNNEHSLSGSGALGVDLETRGSDCVLLMTAAADVTY